MTTPPPAAVRAYEQLDAYLDSKLSTVPAYDGSPAKPEVIQQIISREFAPMVEALEKAIRLAHVPEHLQDDDWLRQLVDCEIVADRMNLKETK